MKILEISNLTKKYGRILALDSLNLSIEKGEIYGLLGPNGSGKTTTLGLITDVLKSDGGYVRWLGEEISPDIKRKIGALIETPNFYPYLSAKRNLQIVCLIKNTNYNEIDNILDFIGLKGRENYAFKTFSLGMKQRLAIGAALIGSPEILIFDEPTNGLDPNGIAEVRKLILKIASEGKTIILASHLLDEVEKVCTKVAILKRGKLLYDGDISLKNNVFELAYENKEFLKKVVDESDNIKFIVDKGDYIEVESEIENPSELNKYFASKALFLSKLNSKKAGLEQIFMDITGLEK